MYNKVGWQNNPSTATPLNATNLNHMDNGIEQANRGISFGGSVTFDGNGVLKSFTDLTSIGTGSFATGDTDIVTAYIGCDVTDIIFINCPNLQTVYIDNTSDNITVSIPEGVNVIYNDDEEFVNVNYFLAQSIRSIANRQVDKVKVAVDLNSTSITDTPVVNLSGCTVDNAPVTGAISGTVVNFRYKFDLESITVQFLIMRNNYTYKRSYSTSNGWSSWVLVADDLSQYLKTADLPTTILSDTPSDTKTYPSNKINELLGEKESLGNKADPGGNGEKHIKYPSLAYLEKYNYNKIETDTLLNGKADKSAVDNNTYDLSMLMSSLVKTSTGTGIVNLKNTAENGILKVTSDSGVTCKNKNIFEDITANGIQKTRCNVSYDNGTYTVEYTGDGNNTFFFGVNVGTGNPYAPYLGEKLKYNKNLSFRINCDKLTRSGCYITYFNADGLSILEKNYKTNTEYKIEDVEGAEFFTMRIGFDYNNGTFATGDILHFSVQIEYGDTVSDFVSPRSNTENLSYEGVTNVISDGEITVEYVPDVMSYIDNKCNEIATALIASESEVN
ncbi:MAG: hypothetical protein SO152_04395 [Ruminococcus sp.]|nr:hypothetical protein [Ruminococcus sp.]